MHRTTTHSANSAVPVGNLDTVRQMTDVAFGLNGLAKQLSGRHQAAAYRLKAATVSALVLLGAVRVNGRREKNTFSLDIVADRRQIHCVLRELLPEAQAEILRQSENAPVVAPLGELIDSDQLLRLKAACPWGGRRAA